MHVAQGGGRVQRACPPHFALPSMTLAVVALIAMKALLAGSDECERSQGFEGLCSAVTLVTCT
jgi:hypothetical protein